MRAGVNGGECGAAVNRQRRPRRRPMRDNKDTWTIDGRRGEGGGQVLRTSLALSILCGRPLVIENIRGGRKNPGLLAQHWTACNAAARVSNGHLEGARVGAHSIALTPSEPQAGTYAFDVKTAGSAALVLQTILFPLLSAAGESRVTIGGGTHNLAAPPVPFLEKAFAPLLARQGAHLDVDLIRAGFFPKGGGALSATLRGWPNAPLSLRERGKHQRTTAKISWANLPPKVVNEERDALEGVLKLRPKMIEVEERTESKGPGNAVFVVVEHENVTEVFTGFAQRGVRAKDVGTRVARAAKRYLEQEGAVGEHLADQLILPLAFAGGVFTTGPLSLHATTQIELVRELIGVEIHVAECAPEKGAKQQKSVFEVRVDEPISLAALRAT